VLAARSSPETHLDAIIARRARGVARALGEVALGRRCAALLGLILVFSSIVFNKADQRSRLGSSLVASARSDVIF